MYTRVPHENFLQKGLKYAEQGLKVLGTAKGIYEVGSAIATGVRAVGPALALL
jgi:hypothetical protein